MAKEIYEVLDATTESDGIGEVTPGFLAESDKIMKIGNDVRDKVANDPFLAERVNRRQSLTLPPSPPKVDDDSGAEGDDEEEVDTGASDEGEEDDWENPGDITPPTSPDGDGHGCCSNQDTCQENHLCHFPGSDTVFTPCICISDNSSSSRFSVEFLGKTGAERDVAEVKAEPTSDASETPRGHAETSNDSVIYIGEFETSAQRDAAEVKAEPTSDASETPRGHAETSNDSVIYMGKCTGKGKGSYDRIIADAVKRSRNARNASSLWVSNASSTPNTVAETTGSPTTSSGAWAQVGIKRKLSPESRAASGSRDAAKTGRPREPRSAQPETPEGTNIPVNLGAGRQGPKMTPPPPTLPSQPPTRRAGYPMFATMRRPDAAIEASLEALLPLPPQRTMKIYLHIDCHSGCSEARTHDCLFFHVLTYFLNEFKK